MTLEELQTCLSKSRNDHCRSRHHQWMATLSLHLCAYMRPIYGAERAALPPQPRTLLALGLGSTPRQYQESLYKRRRPASNTTLILYSTIRTFMCELLGANPLSTFSQMSFDTTLVLNVVSGDSLRQPVTCTKVRACHLFSQMALGINEWSDSLVRSARLSHIHLAGQVYSQFPTVHSQIHKQPSSLIPTVAQVPQSAQFELFALNSFEFYLIVPSLQVVQVSPASTSTS